MSPPREIGNLAELSQSVDSLSNHGHLNCKFLEIHLETISSFMHCSHQAMLIDGSKIKTIVYFLSGRASLTKTSNILTFIGLQNGWFLAEISSCRSHWSGDSYTFFPFCTWMFSSLLKKKPWKHILFLLVLEVFQYKSNM